VGEVIIIFLTKAQVVNISTLQLVVLVLCTPLITHLLVSALRTVLFLTSSR
jgi:hypothetical protein